jgi:hypothetical protein
VGEADQAIRCRLREIDHPVVVALDDPASQRRVGAAARERARRYTVDAMVERTLALQESVVRSGRSAAIPHGDTAAALLASSAIV